MRAGRHARSGTSGADAGCARGRAGHGDDAGAAHTTVALPETAESVDLVAGDAERWDISAAAHLAPADRSPRGALELGA